MRLVRPGFPASLPYATSPTHSSDRSESTEPACSRVALACEVIPVNQSFRVNHAMRSHWLKTEMADAPDLVRAALNDQIIRARTWGVTLFGEAKREAPAQTELRPLNRLSATMENLPAS